MRRERGALRRNIPLTSNRVTWILIFTVFLTLLHLVKKLLALEAAAPVDPARLLTVRVHRQERHKRRHLRIKKTSRMLTGVRYYGSRTSDTDFQTAL